MHEMFHFLSAALQRRRGYVSSLSKTNVLSGGEPVDQSWPFLLANPSPRRTALASSCPSAAPSAPTTDTTAAKVTQDARGTGFSEDPPSSHRPSGGCCALTPRPVDGARDPSRLSRPFGVGEARSWGTLPRPPSENPKRTKLMQGAKPTPQGRISAHPAPPSSLLARQDALRVGATVPPPRAPRPPTHKPIHTRLADATTSGATPPGSSGTVRVRPISPAKWASATA